jgi:Secretion system C-terminal sorting domain
MKYSFFLTFLLLALSTPVVSQTTYCLGYNIVSQTPTHLVVKLSLSGSTAFNLGDVNLVFYFNTNALSAPSLVSTTLGSNFSAPTVIANTQFSLVTINSEYTGAVGQGLAISTTPTEVAKVRFTINNPNLRTGFFTNENFSAVYKSTSPPVLVDAGSGCPSLDVNLPLEWLDFRVHTTTEKGIQNVALDWLTASEFQVQHFIVERSKDGQHFEKIGTPIVANNTATKNAYRVLDKQPLSGASFYRIREVSFNGKESFSVIRSVLLNEDKTIFLIYPNPMPQEGPLSIQTNFNDNYTFNLYNATGKLIFTRLCKGSVELENIDIPSGFYLYECTTQQAKITGKLVVPN